MKFEIACPESRVKKARHEAWKSREKYPEAALERFPGVYLITPFLRYSATVELATFARGL